MQQCANKYTFCITLTLEIIFFVFTKYEFPTVVVKSLIVRATHFWRNTVRCTSP